MILDDERMMMSSGTNQSSSHRAYACALLWTGTDWSLDAVGGKEQGVIISIRFTCTLCNFIKLHAVTNAPGPCQHHTRIMFPLQTTAF